MKTVSLNGFTIEHRGAAPYSVIPSEDRWCRIEGADGVAWASVDNGDGARAVKDWDAEFAQDVANVLNADG